MNLSKLVTVVELKEFIQPKLETTVSINRCCYTSTGHSVHIGGARAL